MGFTASFSDSSLEVSILIEATITDLSSGQNISSTIDTADRFNETSVDVVLCTGYTFDRGLNFNIPYDIGSANILIDE